MMKKLKALILFVGFVGPVADLVRALGALSIEKSRILGELLERFRRDIEAELAEEPTLQDLKKALLAVQAKLTEAASSGAFKAVFLAAFCLLPSAFCFPPSAFAQTPSPSQFAAAGASYNQYNTPQISGWAVYAHNIGGETYSFSLIDITSKTRNPFTVAAASTTGIAQHILDFGAARVFALGTAGISAGGENVGNAFSGGGAAIIPLGRGWSAVLTARALKSSIAGTQAVVGLGFGWGR
jgi:hypothetical protein